jgi:hypothetical protein
MTAITWLKHHHGAASDPKWLAVADMAGSTPANVWSIFSWALEYASERADRGSIAGLNPQVIASFYRFATAEVRQVLAALKEIGVLVGDRISNWAKRQGEHLTGAVAWLGAETKSGTKRMRKWRSNCGLPAAEWSVLRERIFERDGRQCVKCSSTEFLHCDHIRDLGEEGGTNDPENLHTLCRSCHGAKSAAKARAARRDRRQAEMIFSIDAAASPAPSPSAERSAPAPSPIATDVERERDLILPRGAPPQGGDARARSKRSTAPRRTATARTSAAEAMSSAGPAHQLSMLLPIDGEIIDDDRPRYRRARRPSPHQTLFDAGRSLIARYERAKRLSGG